MEILPRFRNPGTVVRSKTSALDLVTDADEAAEEQISRFLEAAFPGVLVIGEEACHREPLLLSQLASAALAVTVDPIDGTANFAAGLPLFGVMAAVVEHGVTTAAVILDPITRSYSAALKKHGAFEHAADGSVRRLGAATAAPLRAMTGMVSWRFMPQAQRDHVLANLTCVAQTWDHRSAAHEYRALIAGHSHFLVFNRLMPWDHLPGVLLQQEAGGFAAKFDGSPYVPGETGGGLICAPSESCWQTLRTALLPRDAYQSSPRIVTNSSRSA